MFVELASTSSGSPWNIVTVLTAVLAVIAVLVSVLALVLNWVNIPKPFWSNESLFGSNGPYVCLINRGVGSADDVRLLAFKNGTWLESEEWEVRAHNDSVGVSIKLAPGTSARVRVTWRTNPLPWLRRRKTFRIVMPSKPDPKVWQNIEFN